MNECLICNILSKERPRIFDETKNLLLLYSKNPCSIVHLLVVTKKHLPQIEILKFYNEMLCSLNKNFPQGYRIVINFGNLSKQTTDHAHLHIFSGEPLGFIGLL